ncbi:50S ribosomal protein L29 [Rickettsia endosymbiont of Cardiosporidium cionae]|uniref:50S ribosomal protein L29 n=1 Tax=Rickettsia endosymbiont of Cardiosporidium cionae TaxID=2777155 RepID=UPI001894ABEF|nr:50S ribosomal protein L29 [Rickettsia endosymbiont of Cardiosporidium cionae]KAF8818194.1 hypothetical protein IHI24_000647 [Rickettsia endosymbiont of Cardiosporidium cionae]
MAKDALKLDKSKFSTKSLSSQSNDILTNYLIDFKRGLFKLRFKKSFGDLSNTSEFKKIRKNIARINTVINMRNVGLIKKLNSGVSDA